MYSFYQKSPMTIFIVNKCENVVIFDNAVLKRKKKYTHYPIYCQHINIDNYLIVPTLYS